MVIALGYFSITMSALATVAIGDQNLALSAELRGVLRSVSGSEMEEVETQAESGWLSLVSEERVAGGYARTRRVEDLSPCLKNIVINVRPDQLNQAHHSYVEGRLLTNRGLLRDVGDDCPAYVGLGTWSDPLASMMVEAVPKGVEIPDVDALGRTLFLAVNASSSPFADLIIEDLDSIINLKPALLASLNTGPGIASLDAAGGYVYAANMSRNAQLQIIDVSDRSAPLMVSSLKLSGAYTDATVGQSIVYHDGRVYLGTNKSQAEELRVIDVRDPAFPFELGAYEVGAGVNSIVVRGSYVYIATPNPEELTVLDVSEPSTIVRAGGFDAPMGLGNGKAVFILGKYLYLGRTVGARELYVLDIADPRTPIEVASFDLNSSIYDMKVTGSSVVLMTSDSARELQVFALDDNAELARIGEHDLSARSRALDIFAEGAVVSDETEGSVHILLPEP